MKAVLLYFPVFLQLVSHTHAVDEDHVLGSSSSLRKRPKKHLLVSYKNKRGKEAALGLASSVNNDVPSLNVVSIDAYEEDAEEILMANDDVLSVEEDTVWEVQGEMEEMVEELDARELTQIVDYGVRMVQAHEVWTKQARIPICLVDTGVDRDHVDLTASRIHGDERNSKLDGSKLKWDEDKQGHGTHTAGIIAARIANNQGVRGVGNLSLHITRGLNDKGLALQSDVVEALLQCRDAGTKIISLSLGGPSISSASRRLYEQLESEGILLISAAGNNNKRTDFYPAALKEVVAVAAVDSKEDRWVKSADKGSNFGDYIELAAPGASIYSTLPGNKYGRYSGTSMAAPFVAGIASVLWSHFPSCTAQQIRFAMAYKAKGDGSCSDEFGYGIVKAKKALDFLRNHPCEKATWGRERGDGICSTIDRQPRL